jgi:O-antigen ligase
MRRLSVFLFTGLAPAGYALVLMVARRSIDWRLVGLAALAGAFALIAIGAVTSEYPGRLVVFGANPIWIARAAFLGALIMVWGPFHPLLKLVTIPVLVFAGLETLSLGPAVGFLVGSTAGLLVALMGRDFRDRRVQAGWAVLCLAIGTAVMLVLAGAGANLLEGAVEDSDNASRAQLVSLALGLFVDAPLFGAGIGAFMAVDPIGYPHNLPVEIAAELGIVGLAMFATWLVLAFNGARKSPILMATLVGTFAFAQFSGSIASNTEFWVISALAIGASYVRSDRTSQRPSMPQSER